MDVYTKSALRSAKIVTTNFSSSFSLASRFFAVTRRQHIYNIYGLVRIADEIVDTYQGKDARQLLDDLEEQVHHALSNGYSTNIIVHAFATTSREVGIDASLVSPFFASMRMDLKPLTYDDKRYKKYIHGSAEVIGLMCLRVFVGEKQYHELAPGAAALGAAFQKINFLRDIKDDYELRNRYYFPIDSYEEFSDTTKDYIVRDIRADIVVAKGALVHLPRDARKAVSIALRYYEALLVKLEKSSASELKSRRLRIAGINKFLLTTKEIVKW